MPRTKPAVRIHLSIAHHPVTADLWSTHVGRSVLTETMRLAGERFAGKRRNRVQLLPADRLSIACADSLEEANSLLESVFQNVKWGVRKLGNDGKRWEVSIRNFAKKQGFASDESDTLSAVPSTRMRASESESESKSESDTGERRSRGVRPCPERLEPEEREAILAWAEANGISAPKVAYGWQSVRDWAAARNVRRKDWAAVLRNGLRKGWVLDGYQDPKGAPPSKPCGCTRDHSDQERERGRCGGCGGRLRPGQR